MPELIKIKQSFNNECITDIESAVRTEVGRQSHVIKPGMLIAVSVGSRGIANIEKIVKTTIEVIKKKGATPFIVPAMGSHGGATAAGQKAILEGYGITERYIGAPIKSSMETVEFSVGNTDTKIIMDKYAYDSDGVVLINRIKPHTDFHGTIESGLLKMSVIGLGKHKQAIRIHRNGVHGLCELIPLTARELIKSGKIIMGIGIVENAYDETMLIKAVLPLEMEQEEKKLLTISKKNMPYLPYKQIDILIVDEMGKEISGTGIDPNIIGRIKIRGEQEPREPDITNIIVCSLTDDSHGNALGVGFADFITKKLLDKINFEATYENVLTSTFTERAKIPVVANTARDAMEYALRTSRCPEVSNARVIRIKNTLKLSQIYVSKPILDEIKSNNNIEIIGSFTNVFDKNGDLRNFDVL